MLDALRGSVEGMPSPWVPEARDIHLGLRAGYFPQGRRMEDCRISWWWIVVETVEKESGQAPNTVQI